MLEIPDHHYFVKNLKTGIHYAVSFPKLQELLLTGNYESLGQVQEFFFSTIVPDLNTDYAEYVERIYEQL